MNLTQLIHKKNRFESRFAAIPELTLAEACRPQARLSNPIEAGKLEFLVQPIYDSFFFAVATLTTKQILFSVPIGQAGNGSAAAKTIFHTNLVQAGMLDAPKKYLVKAVALNFRNDCHATDLSLALGTAYVQLIISGKDYWTSLGSKVPAGGGASFGGIATLGAALSLQVTSNGWPSAQNVATITDPMPQIPGLPAMEPILGVLIEQQQNFAVVWDPTLANAAAFTTQAAVGTVPAGTIGTGINAHIFLEGVLARAVL